MRSETILVLGGWLLAMLLYGLWELYPEVFHGLCVFVPSCGPSVIWSRCGNRIWQRNLDNSADSSMHLAADALAINTAPRLVPAVFKVEVPTFQLAEPGFSLLDDAAHCPSNHHVTCRHLHGNCCPRGKDCCGLGCCPDNARCVDEERGWCCPRAAVLCGDKCVRGACCAGGTLACPNEGETCCGRGDLEDVGDDEGNDGGDKWHREMRCCKRGEYCHAGRECRRESGEEGRGAGETPDLIWALAFFALAAVF